MQVGALSVMLGLTMDDGSWQKGQGRIDHFRRLGLAVGGIFAGKALGKAFLGFNEDVETAKTQIASMFAMTKQTSVAGELENAGKLYDMLRIKAQTLPGETQDYVNMLELLAQPMAKAKLGLEDMRDITAGAFVTAKAMGDTWQAAGRDIGDFINFGKINKVDRYLRKMLQPYGIDATNEGRAKAQGMTLEQRAALIKKSLTSPQAMEMQGALGKTFEGRLETVKDNIKMIFGKIGESLFAKVKESLDKLANWFTNNQATINAWAADVGAAIGAVFDAVVFAVTWLLDHQDVLVSFFVAIGAMLTMMMYRAIAAWLAVAWPVVAGAALFFVLTKLMRAFGLLGTIMIANGVAAALMWFGISAPVVLAIIGLALFAAALYVWKDEIIAIFEEVIAVAETVWDALTAKGKIQVGMNVDQVKKDMGVATSSDWHSTPDLFNPSVSVAPSRNDPAASSKQTTQNVSIGPTTVNINTPDAAGAKDKLSTAGGDLWDAALRRANANVGGSQ